MDQPLPITRAVLLVLKMTFRTIWAAPWWVILIFGLVILPPILGYFML